MCVKKKYPIVRIITNCLYFCEQYLIDKKMKDKKENGNLEQLAVFAKAMGSPVRIKILQFLANQDSCFFGDINEVLPIAKSTVSQHLKELKEAGLIQGEIQPPKVKYCINLENWEIARQAFQEFFSDCKKKESCCE